MALTSGLVICPLIFILVVGGLFFLKNFKGQDFWKIGGLLSFVRVGILWFLYLMEVTHHQSLSLLPFIILLYPDLLVLHDSNWNGTKLFLGTTVLVLGSFLWTGLILCVRHFIFNLSKR